MDRRQFLAGVGVTLIAGCSERPRQPHSKVLELGPLAQFPEGRTVRMVERLMVIRKGDSIKILSLVCSHQECLIAPQGPANDRGFVCPCHGSEFGPEGELISGPAQRPLTAFEPQILPNDILAVNLGSPWPLDQWLPIPARQAG